MIFPMIPIKYLEYYSSDFLSLLFSVRQCSNCFSSVCHHGFPHDGKSSSFLPQSFRSLQFNICVLIATSKKTRFRTNSDRILYPSPVTLVSFRRCSFRFSIRPGIMSATQFFKVETNRARCSSTVAAWGALIRGVSR